MVLSTTELVALLQDEVRILLHLASKIDREQLDYRPTPGQRSTLELMQYLSMMGPATLEVAFSGTFSPPAWTVHERAAQKRTLDEALEVIASHTDVYRTMLADVSDDDYRANINPFGAGATSRGAYIVNSVLGGHAAYRTQLFTYLKACGRHELSTINLWRGADAPARA